MISIVLDIPVTVTVTISATNSSATSVVANSRCFLEMRSFNFSSEMIHPKAVKGKPIKNIRRTLKNHPLSNSVLIIGSLLPRP